MQLQVRPPLPAEAAGEVRSPRADPPARIQRRESPVARETVPFRGRRARGGTLSAARRYAEVGAAAATWTVPSAVKSSMTSAITSAVTAVMISAMTAAVTAVMISSVTSAVTSAVASFDQLGKGDLELARARVRAFARDRGESVSGGSIRRPARLSRVALSASVTANLSLCTSPSTIHL